MADFGVTIEGFKRPRLIDIRRDIIADMQQRLVANGFDSDIETRPDSLMGLNIDTFAEREAAMWEMCEQLYYAMYPGSAVGVSLDNSVSFSGMVRLSAEPSQCNVICYGAFGTTIPAGSQIRNTLTQTAWEITEDITIGAGALYDVTIDVTTVANSTAYTVTVDGTAYTYTSDANATEQEILNGIETAMATAPQTVDNNGAVLTITGVSTNFSVSLSANLEFVETGSQVVAQTVEPIPEAVMPGDLSSIITLIPGWDSVNNIESGTVGRETETDAQLRSRHRLGVFRVGRSTPEAILAYLTENVLGLEEARVFQNNSDSTVDGMAPHSIYPVVKGGLKEDIAQAIYDSKAAGIDTNGSISVSLNTPTGQQTILFDRPTPIYIWVKVVLTLIPTSDQATPFPSTGFEQVRQKIEDYGKTITIGEDVMPDYFYEHILEVPGIQSAVITMDSSTNPAHTPTYSTGAISIAFDELSSIDATRVVVQ